MKKRKMKKSVKKILLIIGLFLASIALLFTINQFKNKEKENIVVDNENKQEEVIEDDIREISLVAVGDIMYHGHQIVKVPSQPSGYDYYDNLKLTKPYFKEADIAIGNYETTSTTSRGWASYPQFNTPPESIDALKDAGIDILSTINNHTLDSGKQGLIDTYNNIKSRGIIPLGTRVSEDQASLINIERKGIKLGFLAYTYGYNGLDFNLTEAEHQYMANKIDEDKIKSEIEKSNNLDNDFTVVMIHWGTEYSPNPNDMQRELANKMVEWGADIILGSHPHVVQASEMINDSFVIYSMGNFLSDQRLESLNNIDTERGLMVDLTLEKNFTTNESRIKDKEFIPLWVNKYYYEDRYFYETIVAKDFLDNKVNPYTPEGSRERIQSAYDETLKRVNSLGE